MFLDGARSSCRYPSVQLTRTTPVITRPLDALIAACNDDVDPPCNCTAQPFLSPVRVVVTLLFDFRALSLRTTRLLDVMVVTCNNSFDPPCYTIRISLAQSSCRYPSGRFPPTTLRHHLNSGRTNRHCHAPFDSPCDIYSGTVRNPPYAPTAAPVARPRRKTSSSVNCTRIMRYYDLLPVFFPPPTDFLKGTGW